MASDRKLPATKPGEIELKLVNEAFSLLISNLNKHRTLFTGYTDLNFDGIQTKYENTLAEFQKEADDKVFQLLTLVPKHVIEAQLAELSIEQAKRLLAIYKEQCHHILDELFNLLNNKDGSNTASLEKVIFELQQKKLGKNDSWQMCFNELSNICVNIEIFFETNRQLLIEKKDDAKKDTPKKDENDDALLEKINKFAAIKKQPDLKYKFLTQAISGLKDELKKMQKDYENNGGFHTNRSAIASLITEIDRIYDKAMEPHNIKALEETKKAMEQRRIDQKNLLKITIDAKTTGLMEEKNKILLDIFEEQARLIIKEFDRLNTLAARNDINSSAENPNYLFALSACLGFEKEKTPHFYLDRLGKISGNLLKKLQERPAFIALQDNNLLSTLDNINRITSFAGLLRSQSQRKLQSQEDEKAAIPLTTLPKQILKSKDEAQFINAFLITGVKQSIAQVKKLQEDYLANDGFNTKKDAIKSLTNAVEKIGNEAIIACQKKNEVKISANLDAKNTDKKAILKNEAKDEDKKHDVTSLKASSSLEILNEQNQILTLAYKKQIELVVNEFLKLNPISDLKKTASRLTDQPYKVTKFFTKLIGKKEKTRHFYSKELGKLISQMHTDIKNSGNLIERTVVDKDLNSKLKKINAIMESIKDQKQIPLTNTLKKQ